MFQILVTYPLISQHVHYTPWPDYISILLCFCTNTTEPRIFRACHKLTPLTPPPVASRWTLFLYSKWTIRRTLVTKLTLVNSKMGHYRRTHTFYLHNACLSPFYHLRTFFCLSLHHACRFQLRCGIWALRSVKVFNSCYGTHSLRVCRQLFAQLIQHESRLI